MKRTLLAVSITTLLGGCFSNPSKEDGTLKDLEQRGMPQNKSIVAAPTPTPSQVITAYQLYLADAPEGPKKIQALRRLADLQMEAQEQGEQMGGVEAYKDAARRYRDLLARYPDGADTDVVLYQLAKAEDLSGNSDGSLDALTRLTKYPYSHYYFEAQFRRGEALFARREYDEAAQAYGALVHGSANSSFLEQSMFKYGWCRFKQANYADAQDTFIDLLDRLLAPERKRSRGDDEALADTLRVMSVSFGYQDGPAAVAALVARKGARPYEDRIYHALGALYRDQGRHQDAANTYAAFVEQHTNHARGPEFMQAVVDAYATGGFTELALDAKREFAERYGIRSVYWQRHPQAITTPARALLKTHLGDLAAYYHARAQKQKSAADYTAAAQWYRSYLEGFDSEPEAPQMNFLLAEALFESQQYPAAAAEYERVAYQRKDFARAADAGYAAILAHHAQRDRSSDKARAAAVEAGLKSSLAFADRFPEDPRALPVVTRAADELFAAGDLTRSTPLAERVLAAKPPAAPELRRTAHAVVAHSLFQRGRYPDAEQHYAAVLALLPAADPSRAKYGDNLAATIYKQGEAARAAGDYRAAAGHFMRLGEQVPNSEFRATAHYDAAASLIQAKEWQQAATLLEDFRRRYPQHKLTTGVPEKLAACYLEQGAHAKAATELQRLTDLRTDPRGKREAAWQSAELYTTAKDEASARRAYERYVGLFPEPIDDATEARHRLAEIYRKNGESQAHYRMLQQIVQGVGDRKVKDGTRLIAARAILALAQPARDEFERIKLRAPLKVSLKKKKAAMQAVLKAYEQAASYGVSEVTTAAAYHTAEIYNRFSKDLLASDRPNGLNGDELEQYNVLLEEQAFPFEEQAIELHSVNAARTRDGIYDEWVRKSLQQLAELRPVQYAKAERGEEVDDALQ